MLRNWKEEAREAIGVILMLRNWKGEAREAIGVILMLKKGGPRTEHWVTPEAR